MTEGTPDRNNEGLERKVSDPEIAAMQQVSESLAPLDSEARGRVLRWAWEKFTDVDKEKVRQVRGTDIQNDSEDFISSPREQRSKKPDVSEYEHFAELFDRAAPKTEIEKALVAGYWFQVIKGEKSWQSLALQKELKNLGHGIANISEALTSSIETKPSRVLQLGKAGSSRQARKTYKLTVAGIAYVNTLLEKAEGEG
jgi:hypothetical protein